MFRLVQVNHPCYIQFLEKCGLFMDLFLRTDPWLTYHRFVSDNAIYLALEMKIFMFLPEIAGPLDFIWHCT